MLTVLSPAGATDLTTVAAVKAALDIAGTDHDALLSDLIARTSAAIATHCGRVFGREPVRETLRPERPVPSVALSRLPVVAIASVTMDDAPLADTAFEIDGTAGTLRRLDAKRRYLCWEAGVIEVAYTAGWLLPGEAGRDLPADVEHAAVLLVSRWWHARARDPLERSTSVDGVASTSHWTGAPAFTPEVAALLDGHRLPAVG